MSHVLELIHLPNGRFTVDCRSREHPLPGGAWFHMNIPDEAEAGRIIAAHRRTYMSPSTLGGSDG